MQKRFIKDGIMIRDLEGKIPSIITHNRTKQMQFLNGLNELNESIDKNKQLRRQISVYKKFLELNDLDIDWYEFCTSDECISSEDEEIDCQDCQYMGGIQEVIK